MKKNLCLLLAILTVSLSAQAATTPLLVFSTSRNVVTPTAFNALSYDRQNNIYAGQYFVGAPENLRVITVDNYAGETKVPTNGSLTIVSEVTLAEALAASDAVIDTLTDAVWATADYYGVTNSPLDWFILDATINAASESTNDVTAMKALRDGVRLDKNALFLKEWGVDLFNITR